MPNIGIVAIAKNEGRYMMEWCAHHIAIGFDHIWLYDNGSTDDTAIIVDHPGIRDHVTRIPWPTPSNGVAQVSAYADWLRHYRAQVDWVMTLDLDELVVPKVHDTIGAFLSDYPDADAIAISWRIFGDSGHPTYSPEMLSERFTMASESDFGTNHIPKTIARTASITTLHIHTHALIAGARFVHPFGATAKPFPACRQDRAEHDLIQVNHYFGKTAEEWEWKKARGRADLPPSHPQAIRQEAEFRHNNRNDTEDVSALRFAAAVKRIMAHRVV